MPSILPSGVSRSICLGDLLASSLYLAGGRLLPPISGVISSVVMWSIAPSASGGVCPFTDSLVTFQVALRASASFLLSSAAAGKARRQRTTATVNRRYMVESLIGKIRRMSTPYHPSLL